MEDVKENLKIEVFQEFLDIETSPLPSASCRCCLLENNCKSITSEYIWNDQKVLYSDLIKDTFGVTLSTAEDLTQAICETCIARLIDATEFKKQVQECEASLRKESSSVDTFNVELEPEPVKPELKLQKAIKEETIDIDDIVDDTITIDDDDDDYDPLLSEILSKPKTTSKKEKVTKTALKWPANSKPTNKNKRILVPSNKLKDIAGMPPNSNMKSLKIGNKTVLVKVHNTRPKPVTSQNINKMMNISKLNAKKQVTSINVNKIMNLSARKDLTVKRTLINNTMKGHHAVLLKNKSRSNSPVTEKAIPEITRVKMNAKIIVQFSTVYPFRLPMPYVDLTCVYCGENKIQPGDIKTHMDENHPNTVDIRKAFAHVGDVQLKVEITDLKCRICKKLFDTIEEIAKHLKEDHNKDIDLLIDLGLAPFKFKKNEVFACAVCEKQFIHVTTLSKHTTTHYSKCICEQCGKSYSSPSVLRNHQMVSHTNKHVCVKCKSAFETRQDLVEHFKNSERCRHYICTECGDRFVTQNQKRNHMMSVHGKSRCNYKCFICREEFATSEACTRHAIKSHNTNCPQCQICDKKFVNPKQLAEHVVIHSGVTPYECQLCDKSYSTRKTLTQHMRINHRHHYSCSECNQHFGCKSSLLNHNAKYHKEDGRFLSEGRLKKVKVVRDSP